MQGYLMLSVSCCSLCLECPPLSLSLNTASPPRRLAALSTPTVISPKFELFTTHHLTLSSGIYHRPSCQIAILICIFSKFGAHQIFGKWSKLNRILLNTLPIIWGCTVMMLNQLTSIPITWQTDHRFKCLSAQLCQTLKLDGTLEFTNPHFTREAQRGAMTWSKSHRELMM